MVSGFIKGLLDTSPDISKLEVVPSKFATKIYDSKGKVIQELKGAEANREYVSIENRFIAIIKFYNMPWRSHKSCVRINSISYCLT